MIYNYDYTTIVYYRIILKYIFIISAISLLLVIFNLNNYYNQNNKAEVIISVNNLNSVKIMNSLEEDFNNYSGIKFIDGSLMANTIVLEVDDNDIQISALSKLLENWGCTIKSISYRILGNIQ